MPLMLHEYDRFFTVSLLLGTTVCPCNGNGYKHNMKCDIPTINSISCATDKNFQSNKDNTRDYK